MAHTLKISDGTTEVDFRGSNFKVLWGQWAPKRARRSASALAGALYDNVVERIAFTLEGTDAADVLAKLETLDSLLDQAERWRAGANVSAVYVEYEPANSNLAASVKAVIVGPPPGGTYLHLPGDFDILLAGSGKQLGTETKPLVLEFQRRGLWLGATEAEASSASTGNPAELSSSTFTDTAGIPWPYDLDLELDVTASGFVASDIWILLQNAADKADVLEAEDGTLNSGVTSEVDADASGGDVARVDSQANTNAKSLSIEWALAADRRYAFWAMVRSRSASAVNWDIWGVLREPDVGGSFTGRKTTIEAGDNERQVVFLGIFNMPSALSTQILDVYAQNDATGGGSDADDLDIDYVAAIVLDDTARVLEVSHSANAALGDSSLIVEHQLEDEIAPRVYMDLISSGVKWDYPTFRGSLLLAAPGNLIKAVVFGNDQAGANWRLEDGAGNAINLTLRVTRSRAYLVPY